MKRSITMSVGALVLSQLLAFTALAAPNSKCYSTGPLVEEGSGAETYVVQVLNNGQDGNVEAMIVAFDLNGQKTILQEEGFLVGPLASDSREIGVGGTEAFEIQVMLDGMAADKYVHDMAADNVLLGGFATTDDGEPVSALRLVHSEWTEMECQDFGLESMDTDGGAPEAPEEDAPEAPEEDTPQP
jgi:hypothetical protein